MALAVEDFAHAPAAPDLRLVPAPARAGPARYLLGTWWTLVGAAALFLLLPCLGIPFGLRTLVVTSGSMEPAARTGDAIVLAEPDDDIEVGDVITFRPLRDGGVTTHRVASIHEIEGSGTHYRTRGDANPDFDPNLVPANNVLGRVVAVLPAVGRVYAFAVSTTGRILFVGLPALVLIVGELRRLLQPGGAVVARARRRRSRRAPVALAVLCAVLAATPAAARFSDAPAVGANALSAGRVDPPVLTGASAQLVPCRVNLTWSVPAAGVAPDGYDIYRSTTSGGPYTFRKHVGAVTSASDDTGPLAALTTYHYVIRSTRAAWTSGNSNQRSVTTLLCAL